MMSYDQEEIQFPVDILLSNIAGRISSNKLTVHKSLPTESSFTTRTDCSRKYGTTVFSEADCRGNFVVRNKESFSVIVFLQSWNSFHWWVVPVYEYWVHPKHLLDALDAHSTHILGRLFSRVVATDIVRPLPRPKPGNQFVEIITDWCIMLTRAIPTTKIISTQVFIIYSNN